MKEEINNLNYELVYHYMNYKDEVSVIMITRKLTRE